MKFIDEVTIIVSSGKGGAGAVSFRREAMTPRGGPDGGDGGSGGDVIIRGDGRLRSLLDLKLQKIYRAEDGDPGSDRNRSGSKGKDLILSVPPGTLIKNKSSQILHDVVAGQEFVFLPGGLGGKGNVFYKSSVNQAPTVAQKGLPGQEMEIQLELKLLADVGIIGLPNAGKSTLISRISSAKPKIADYPFTTLTPNLGVVRFHDDKTFVVADIPGLIEGAHSGVGLGTQFLRHVERCRLLVHLIDVNSMTGKEPLAAYDEIRRELELYDEHRDGEEGFQPLSNRLEIITLSKIETVDEDRLNEIRAQFRKRNLITHEISAATGKNLREFINELGKRVLHEN